jgi:mono/diheme cytochrome c family protein
MDTSTTNRPLAGLPLFARLGVTGFLGIALLGIWASVKQIEIHHGKSDGEPGLSAADVRGGYHTTTIPSPMLAALEGTLDGHPPLDLADDQRAALYAWLESERPAQDFDDIDLDLLAPVEILAERCSDCHAKDGSAAAFSDFADVKGLLAGKRLEPPPPEVRWTSLHTHAPGMVGFGLLLAFLALFTRFGPKLRSAPIALAGIGIALDLGAWIPARETAGLVNAIIAGGALYSSGCILAVLLVLIEVWLPRPPERS